MVSSGVFEGFGPPSVIVIVALHQVVTADNQNDKYIIDGSADSDCVWNPEMCSEERFFTLFGYVMWVIGIIIFCIVGIILVCCVYKAFCGVKKIGMVDPRAECQRTVITSPRPSAPLPMSLQCNNPYPQQPLHVTLHSIPENPVNPYYLGPPPSECHRNVVTTSRPSVSKPMKHRRNSPYAQLLHVTLQPIPENPVNPYYLGPPPSYTPSAPRL